MTIEREYKPKEKINWKLLPNILNDVLATIPQVENKPSFTRIWSPSTTSWSAEPYFKVSTYSQSASIEEVEDFLAFIKKSKEDLEGAEIGVSCYQVFETNDRIEEEPPYFLFSWKPDRLYVIIGRNTTENALKLLEDLEGKLELTPAAPLVKHQDDTVIPLRRTVFIAYSFDKNGKSYASELKKFFELLEFKVATGEEYSPESVSKKVERRLESQEIVVAVLSKRVNLSEHEKLSEHESRSEQKVQTWLTQEMSRVKNSKPLFLLVEKGAKFEAGILGDLEYVTFEEGRITDTFTSIIEGLREVGFRFI